MHPVLIIVPAYSERENIPVLLEQLYDHAGQVQNVGVNSLTG